MINREMQKFQEELLFENCFAQEMLAAKKFDEYQRYLDVRKASAISGMTAEEIDAVMKRAQDSAKKYA